VGDCEDKKTEDPAVELHIKMRHIKLLIVKTNDWEQRAHIHSGILDPPPPHKKTRK